MVKAVLLTSVLVPTVLLSLPRAVSTTEKKFVFLVMDNTTWRITSVLRILVSVLEEPQSLMEIVTPTEPSSVRVVIMATI